MKHIEVHIDPDRERAPPFLTYVFDDPGVTEARVIDWNRVSPVLSTELYAITGDVSKFGALASETDGVESVEVAAVDEEVSYVLLEIRKDHNPTFNEVTKPMNRAGLIVQRPIIYRDGSVLVHVVGDPDALQAAIDELPDTISADIKTINQFPYASSEPVRALSERQYEAIRTALAMGYYNIPREVTQEDIGAELGCAPNTASRHLQKAEAKLVTAVLHSHLPESAVGP